MPSLLDKLEDINDKNVRSWFGYAGLLDFIAGARQQEHNKARLDSQVDALLKCKHGDDYQPPDPLDVDEMQRLQFGNNVIFGETNAEIMQALLGNQPDKESADKPTEPQPKPTPEPQPIAPPATALPSWVLPALVASGLAIGGLGGALIAHFMAPEPTFSDVFVPTEIDK